MARMAEDDMVHELEFRLEVLELRMHQVICRVERSTVVLIHIRQRIQKLESVCNEVLERGSFVSSLEVRENISLHSTTTLTEVSHGALERQNEEPERLVVSEEIAVEIERELKWIVKYLEESSGTSELSVNSLQQTERESNLPEDLAEDDDKSADPSPSLRFSDESKRHTIEDSGQVKASEKADEQLRDAKDVRMEQQTDECGEKLIVLIQEVEQLKETEETDPIKAHKKPKVKKKFKFEDERKSEDVQRKSNEFEIQFVDIGGCDSKDLLDLDKGPETGTPIEMVHDMDRRTHHTGTENPERDLAEESRTVSVEEVTTELEAALGTLWAIGSDVSKEFARYAPELGRIQEEVVQSKAEEEEEVKYDYESKMAEMVGHFEEFKSNTSEELDKWLSEEGEKRKELEQSIANASLILITDVIEVRMNARVPNGLRKKIDEYFRKTIEVILKTFKLDIKSLECELQAVTNLKCWLQGQIRHLDTALRKTVMKEKSFKERIRELQDYLNITLMALQTSDNYVQQLLGKYDEVTLNIEREMNKHRNLCQSYKNLTSAYEELKAKCESTAKSGDGREVAGQADEALVEGRYAATDVEEQMSELAKSQRELKKKIISYNEGPPLLGNLNKETVENSDVLDGYCKIALDTLERQPHVQCELIEEALADSKSQYDYLWKGIIRELELTLHTVVGTDCPLLTNLLLEYGFSLECIDNEGNTALHCAAKGGNVHVGRALLKAGALVNVQNSRKMTPLHVSLYFGHVNFSLMLLRNGVNHNLTDLYLNTPLHMATMSGNFVMVNQLIEDNANVNAVDADGDTPFFNAAIIGDKDMAEMLVQAGSDVAVINGMGSTPLHVAAWQGKTSFCLYLLRRGVSADPINLYDVTPLQLAAMENHVYVVQLLIRRGARVNCLADRADSPLHYAAEFCNVAMMKALIRAGANISAINSHERTPLHIAAAKGHTETCLILLEAGSDVNALDVNKRTPLHMVAMYGGSISLAESLIKKGANMTAVDRNGLTPCKLGYVYKYFLFSKWLEKRILVTQPQRGKGARKKRKKQTSK